MTNNATHNAFSAAFFQQQEKALLCDAQGIILCASKEFLDGSQIKSDEVTGQLLHIESRLYSQDKPWFKNLASHYKETRTQGIVNIGGADIQSDPFIISVQPLSTDARLSGFKIVLTLSDQFEQSLPLDAWQTLFNQSDVATCLFDERFTLLSANSNFHSRIDQPVTPDSKVYQFIEVKQGFKHWFLNTSNFSREATLIGAGSHKKVYINITPIQVAEQELYWCTLKDTDFIEQRAKKLSTSLERFQNLFSHSGSGIALASRQGFYVETNQTYADMLQLERDDIIGRHFTAFNAPGSYELPEEEGERFAKTGFSRPFEKTLLRKDGKAIKVAIQLFPDVDETGTIIGAWNYIQLMDEGRQQHIDTPRYYEALFNNDHEAMVLTQLDGRIRMTNNAFCRLTKRSAEQLQALSMSDLTASQDFEQGQEQLLQRGFTDLHEQRFICSDGREIPLAIRSYVVCDVYGKPEAIWNIVRDASPQRKLIESLAASERRFRSLFSNSIDAIAFWTRRDELQYANKAYLDLVGYSQEELRNLTYADFTPPGWEDSDRQMSEQVQLRGFTDIFEKEVLRKNGERVPITIRASAMTDQAGDAIGSWVIIRDISDYKKTLRELIHSQNMLQQTSRMSRVGGWELNPELNEFTLTDETFQILSIPRSYHTTQKNILKLFEPESEQRAVDLVNGVLKTKNTGTSELKLAGFSPERWIRVSAQLAYEESGQRYVYGAVQDITDFMQQQKSLETARDNFQRMAFHDPLTKLPNRLLLEDRFQQISNQAKRDQKMVALIIIDLDGFKAINDKNGHPAGDELLIQLAKRLQRSIRSSDTVARLGGDEFVVIAMLKDQNQAEQLAEKILNSVKQPVAWQSLELQTTCSIGVALSNDHQESYEDLYATADKALYRVKKSGKGAFSFQASETTAPIKPQKDAK